MDNGVFWHECLYIGCTHMVEFDDEPYCYSHSPDSGSSIEGFSARAEAEKGTISGEVIHKNVFNKD